jgi:serine/threonine protein kinase
MSDKARLVIANAYEVLTDTLVPEFSTPDVPAYSVRELNSDKATMFGLLCDSRLTARLDYFNDACNISSPGFMRAVQSAVVLWPDTNVEHLFLIYQAPEGGSVANVLREADSGLPEDKVIQGFIVPAVQALDVLNSYKRTHRGIRFDNLYFIDSTQTTIIIGDGASAPAAYHQPAQFETVAVAATDEAARGEGTQADDIYALGVSILSLLLGKMPLEGHDVASVINEKIIKSSFGALATRTRFQFNITELLRGMLHDDPQYRWSLRDIDAWLNGSQTAPKQLAQVKRAPVAFQIGNRTADNARSLAYLLGNDWSAAAPIIRSASFSKWLNESLSDPEVTGQIRAIVGPNQFVQDLRKGPDDVLITNMCIALDPSGPVRHRGMALQLSGIGTALAAHSNDVTKSNALGSVIKLRFAKNWVALQTRSQSDYFPLLSIFEGLPAFAESNAWGEGVERCLYKLNLNTPCLSPLLANSMAYNAEGILRGLDAAAVSVDQALLPFDRHIAAFLLARELPLDQEEFDALNADEVPPIVELLTVVSMLTRLQVTLKLPPVPHLCGWVVSLAKVVFDQYHNLNTREMLTKKALAIAKKGELSDVLDLLNDGSALQKDRLEFSRAVKTYAQQTRQVNAIEQVLENRSMIPYQIGDQVAAIIAGIIGAVGSSVILILWLVGKV